MKTEAFAFSADASTKTIVLDDDTLQVKGAVFMVMKDGTNVNIGSGVASPGKNFGGAVSYNTSKSSDQDNSKCMMARDNTTVKVAGSVDADGFDTVGEISMSFSSYDATYRVIGLAFGE